MHRKTEALIDLEAIRNNYALACALAPQSKNIAVIKADAYGHGVIPVAEALQSVVPAFAVAIIDEAIELRGAGITVPLLVLEGVNSTDAIEAAVANGLSLMVHSEEQVSLMQQARLTAPALTWLKVDTGMHRLGLPPEQLATALERLRDCACDVSVICTHLACADDPGDDDVTENQLGTFRACAADLGLPLSIANSAGILAWPESHADWNRPGYMLYGDSPMASEIETAQGLQPAMTLRSELIAIHEIAAGEAVGYGGRWKATRPSKIGTVACGYADGYPRHVPDGPPTIVNGCIAPLAGAVSMDMITVDVTGIEGVRIGDAVTLWGEGLSVNTIANAAGTIGYELLTGVTSRVPRITR